jgi:hypothetical protein
MQMMFVPHRKHTYGPSRPVNGSLSLYFSLRLSLHHNLWLINSVKFISKHARDILDNYQIMKDERVWEELALVQVISCSCACQEELRNTTGDLSVVSVPVVV